MIKKQILIYTGCLSLFGTLSFLSYGAQQPVGRFTIVAAVKHKQFMDLYAYLLKEASSFDPRYAGSLRTSGTLQDEHKNLHITLASTGLRDPNQEICETALESIKKLFSHEIHINFNPSRLRLDQHYRVILPVVKDAGYKHLKILSKQVIQSLQQLKASEIHLKKPDHITIGFASALPKSPFNHEISYGRVTHARLYHWKGSGIS